MTQKEDEKIMMAAKANCEKLINHQLSFCLNLVRFEDPAQPKEPCGMATGFLVSSGDRTFLPTAGHAARRDAVWHWETNVVLQTERKVMCLPLGPFTVLSTISTHLQNKAKVTDIDFGWCPLMSPGSSRNSKRTLGSKATNLSFLSTGDPSTRPQPSTTNPTPSPPGTGRSLSLPA